MKFHEIHLFKTDTITHKFKCGRELQYEHLRDSGFVLLYTCFTLSFLDTCFCYTKAKHIISTRDTTYAFLTTVSVIKLITHKNVTICSIVRSFREKTP